MTRFLALIISISSLLFGCTKDSLEDLKNANTTTAQTINYSPNNIESLKGNIASSNLPSISPTDNYSFNVSSSPNSDKFSVDSKGKISFENTLETGVYSLSVTLSNIAGARTFENVFTIKITDIVIAPTALTYTIDSTGIPLGVSFLSPSPNIQGTGPFNYSLTSTPTSSEITISTSGEISASSNLAIGTYQIDVTASNSAGSETFDKAYTITSADVATFTKDVLPIINSKCASCHTSGGSLSQLNNYASAKNSVNSILNRIQRSQGSGGFMPQGRTALSSVEIEKIQNWLDQGLFE